MSSGSSLSDLSLASGAGRTEYHSLDFKLHVESVKASGLTLLAAFWVRAMLSFVQAGCDLVIHLVAPTKQEKAAWITDISQCMDNVHFDNLYNNTNPHAAATAVPQFVKSDPSLFQVSKKISKFSDHFADKNTKKFLACAAQPSCEKKIEFHG